MGKNETLENVLKRDFTLKGSTYPVKEAYEGNCLDGKKVTGLLEWPLHLNGHPGPEGVKVVATVEYRNGCWLMNVYKSK